MHRVSRRFSASIGSGAIIVQIRRKGRNLIVVYLQESCRSAGEGPEARSTGLGINPWHPGRLAHHAGLLDATSR